MLTESSGHVEIEVPRDRAGTFEPQIVRKRQRRLTGIDEIVLSLYAKGLTTGEISAHSLRSMGPRSAGRRSALGVADGSSKSGLPTPWPRRVLAGTNRGPC